MNLDTPRDIPPLLSVVIPIRNGAATLPQQLQALANQHSAPVFEIIISDNGSEDNLQAVLRKAAQSWPSLNLRCVDSAARRGVSHARNAGARVALAPYIAFCDSDDVVSLDWVRAMAEGLEQFDGIGGALDEESLNDEHAGRQALAQSSLPVGLGFLPYPAGANCGVRRDVWAKLNGFDENFLYGAEEVDFYWRLQLAGYRLGFVAAAVVAYRHPHGLWKTARRAFRYGVGSCQLAAAHRTHLPQETWLEITRAWLNLLVGFPLIAWPERRLNYFRRLAHSAGQIIGSYRYRVLHLA
jgi:GT2 family glycosyltransferase